MQIFILIGGKSMLIKKSCGLVLSLLNYCTGQPSLRLFCCHSYSYSTQPLSTEDSKGNSERE